MIKRILPLMIMTLICLKGWSQDPQFSQFYANPLYLNPALAGGALAPRLTANYRNQWPALSANFVTASFGADVFLPNYNSGIGVQVTTDSQGLGNLKATDVALQYSYQINLNDVTSLRLGIQGGFASRSLDYYGLTFGDQFNNGGFTGNPSTDPFAQGGPNVSYADFSTGMMVYSDWYWLGLAAHHINRPNQAFSGTEARLPVKASLQAGLRIPFAGYTFLGNEIDKEKSISPAILYKKQGKYDQLDMGLYVTIEPLVLGMWYRGIPFKKYEPSINNHESLVFLAGFRQDKFSIGYSYDLTISTLGAGSGGAHEISLSYIFEPLTPKPRRSRSSKHQLSCPKF
ncbi:type IX secretion system membrane protein, PorP/SprF family [Dyadobacter koreensis]|uniref:Type IX secretion system membrane protein, PorP/SprF family n=1 Tax=Dyadobacter koreensis TaxID=408657 RepID=A0A1H7A7I2_9BACT|nr:type IX secretion system membrane protein PorP/SprF [Dyadobacter koreensis]SEJ57005.1 type IX secretion system membrane protein, PorP/SprF family [Dyadobacter koreensis]